jgi:hypothetical protein
MDAQNNSAAAEAATAAAALESLIEPASERLSE